MRIIGAKEYKMNQTPKVGEYSLYRYNNEYFFTIGDGCTPIDHLIDLPGHLVIKISEPEFLMLKRINEKYPAEKGPYPLDKLDEEELLFYREMFKFDASKE